MTRKASALVHNAHEHVISQQQIHDPSAFQRPDPYSLPAIQDVSSASDSARGGLPDMSVYGNRQQFIEPILEQPRAWNQRGFQHTDSQQIQIEEGVKIMPERNFSSFHQQQEQIMPEQIWQNINAQQNMYSNQFNSSQFENSSQQMLIQQSMVASQYQQDHNINMQLPGQSSAVSVAQAVAVQRFLYYFIPIKIFLQEACFGRKNRRKTRKNFDKKYFISRKSLCENDSIDNEKLF